MHGLVQDHWPQPWLEGVGEHKIYLAAETLFEIGLEVHVGIEGWLIELNQKIEVTILVAFTPDG